MFHPLKIFQNRNNHENSGENIEYFNYLKVAKELDVPASILNKIENEIKKEFPTDKMLFELHVLRTLKNRGWQNSED